MKKSAQAGIVHVGLIVGLVILGVATYFISQNSPNILSVIKAASTKGTFSNVSANLKLDQATFNFTYNGDSTAYVISVSTDSRMRKNVFSPFGSGPSSPIVVNNTQAWSGYQCGATVYWKINATVLKGAPVASSIQKAGVDCSTPSPAPTSSPTPTPSPTPIVSPTPTPVGVGSTAPITANTTSYPSGYTTDGTWCYNYDGKTAGPTEPFSVNIGIGTQSFCVDNTGVHTDVCESDNIAGDYYCNLYRFSDGTSTTRCETQKWQCSPSALGWETCTRGACTIANPPAAQASSTTPSSFNLKGADNTWCYATNPNIDHFIKGTCQDQRGIFTDYCNGSSKVQKYYCTGDWNGSVYNNVRCEVQVDACSNWKDFNTGKTYICSEGKCLLP